MTDGSGPGLALLILLAIAVVLVLAGTGFVVTRRRKPPAPPQPHPDTATKVEAGPPGAPVVAEPVTLPPVEAPPAEETPTEAPPVEAPPIEAPPVEAPPVESPPVEAAPVEAAPKRRVRGIGAGLRRLFRGTALTAEELEELEEILLRADVGVASTQRILDAVRADASGGHLDSLRSALLRTLGDADRSLHEKEDGLTIWLVTGVNGAGKTTTIGKLSAQQRARGRTVLLAAADTFRAAADEQLERWAERAGADVVKHAPGADPAAVVFDGVAAARARGVSTLIVDTAGRLHTKKTLMDELAKINRVLEREAGRPDEVLLVMDATTGQNGLQQAKVFAEAAPVTGITLTKLDGTAKGGIVVAVQQELGIPVKLVGLGEGIEDLAGFDPETFVDDLLAADSPA